MKSLNVKKIVAVAAGAALIGTALAGAAVTVDDSLGNYVFLQNGEPQVKIAVGSAALPSDAVWAGNIAAALANKAYTTSAAAPAAGASGTTVAPVNVQVQTAANAVPAGTYGFTSFFGDDRVDNGAENTYNRTATSVGYNGNLAATKDISSSTTSLVHDTTIDTKGKYSGSITAREHVYLFGSADYSSSSDKYIVRTPRAWYVQTFSPGLPACLDTTQAFDACASNSRLDRAGIHLNFLGMDYLVSNVAMAGTGLAFNTMTLSKASTDQIVQEGSSITDPSGYRVDVLSISAPQTTASVSSIGVRVTSPTNSSELATLTAGAAPTKFSGNVYVQVPDAYYTTSTGQKSTARVIFATGSLRLVQNTTIDETVYGKWQVAFTTNNVSTSQAISQMQIGNDNGPTTLNSGDSLQIIQGAQGGFTWTFQGSSLTPSDFSTLTVEPVGLDSISINGNASTCSYSTIHLSSSLSNAFRIGNDQKSQVWFLAKNKTADVAGSCNQFVGYWIYQNSSSVYVNFTAQSGTASQTLNANNFSGDTGWTSAATFYYPGSGSDVSVPINVSTTTGHFNLTGSLPTTLNATTGNATYFNVTVPEILNDSISSTDGQWNIPMVYGAGSPSGSASATDLGIRDAFALTTSGKINYTTPSRVAADQAASYFGDAPLYSPRGSYVGAAATSTQYVIQYASKLGRAQYVLSSSGTNLTAGTSSVPCTPGVVCNIGGAQVTLPVGAGAAAGSNQVAVRLNTATQPLVVLDSEASSTQPLIVVGGPFVNSVAASMQAASAFDTCNPSVGGDAVVKVEGNKVLVAGCSASDTMDAAKALINFLANPTAPAAPAGNATRATRA